MTVHLAVQAIYFWHISTAITITTAVLHGLNCSKLQKAISEIFGKGLSDCCLGSGNLFIGSSFLV